MTVDDLMHTHAHNAGWQNPHTPGVCDWEHRAYNNALSCDRTATKDGKCDEHQGDDDEKQRRFPAVSLTKETTA